MRSNRLEYNPAKTIVFIIICAAMLIAGDIFLFDGKNIIRMQTDKANIVTSFVAIEELQKKHEQYMKQGILPPHSSRRPAETINQAAMDKELEPFMPIEPFEIPEEATLPQSKPEEPVSVAKAETGDLLQDIEPASGGIANDPMEPPPFPETSSKMPDAVVTVKPIQEEVKSDDLLQNDTSELETVAEPAITPEVIIPQNETPVNSGKKPRIAIIIDDMGLSLRGRQLEVMSYPLTLSYLPYAENLKERTAIARKNGHELMVHMPMEAMKDKNGGPRILEISDDDAEFTKTVEWGLSQFDGYVGLNNHMGSRLTQDSASMNKLMNLLKDKNLYFVDSKTIGSSVAEEMAAKYGLSHAGRDVFLDHEISRSFVDQALRDLEQIARQKGSAIAIGHPHKETIESLKVWLPTLAEKGIELVPVSALVRKNKSDADIFLAAQQSKNEDAMDGGSYNMIEPSAPTQPMQ